ncbi:MAG: hypothetical protein H7320_19970 [Ferruginibacter sp.]|nr:hypothetical protein [Ferruginibacter sp.]
MIQTIAGKYNKHIAYPLFILFYLQTIILPLRAAVNIKDIIWNNSPVKKNVFNKYALKSGKFDNSGDEKLQRTRKDINLNHSLKINLKNTSNLSSPLSVKKITGGPGPSSPEALSFKAVGSDNLVNLFTGDFSYSIPLLDVGGYPVNLFYNGGITMEQEASWVGLGWNINPGTVNRNMRGVPDDFNGDDKLTQTQYVKPNRTWGGEVGYDVELLGIKKPKIGLNASLGVSYNNYLGPALDIGAGVSLTIPITENIKPEKGAPKELSAGIGLNAKLSSRSGLTFSPSLNAGLALGDKINSIGAGISTSYNSRTGIKELNFSMSTTTRGKPDKDGQPSDYNMRGSIASSTISFARPSFMPTLRMPMQYSNYSGQLEFGAGMFGVRGAFRGQGYYSESKVPAELRVVKKPLVGFMYSEKAVSNKDAVMDFNRLSDGEVTPNTPILSAPQYAYDVFSIQGEGTGGVIRAYRGDLGFMKDNETTSRDENISIGLDIAPPGHFGGNWNIMHTPTRVGGWEDGNNLLRKTLAFQGKANDISFENVYFRNPGEATVSNPDLINRIGRDNLVRFKLGGSKVNPVLESSLEQFNKKTLSEKGILPIFNSQSIARDKRTQVTTMLTAKEASEIGLEKKIRNYIGTFSSQNNIDFDSIGRTDEFRKPHHISEINVLEQSGMRYVYGLPVYNILQKDYTFSVNNIGDPSTGIVNFEALEPTLSSPHMNNNSKLDGYLMTQETPGYAVSFLLTGLLSPDYVDVTGNGITEDDLGNAVKFDYNKSGIHKWRTPRATGNTAHFMEGLKSEKKDNKGTITYGEREVWYLDAIESKSMVAIFKTETRSDAKGVVSDVNGATNGGEDANKRLKQIDLYTKAEIKAKGIANARPIKTVNFRYSYQLCSGTPDNAAGGGKLTLDSVFFTYNGQIRAVKDKYVFNYQYNSKSGATDNPGYAHNASDKWGTYKEASSANPPGLVNADYPYTSGDKTKSDAFAGAWSLKRILLPSGGQMEIQYEADDYGYVQNRRACDMLNIYGLGINNQATTNNGLYRNGTPASDNMYVYIKLPQPLQNTDPAKQKQEIFEKYLEGLNQLAFKLLINMPKGPEALTVYTKYDDYGLCTNSTATRDIIYLKLQSVNGKSPLSNSSIGFLTENIPGQAFENYETEVNSLKDFLGIIGEMLVNIKSAFKNVDDQMRSVAKGRTIQLDRSFVRLDNSYKIKLGGGARVKKVLVKDNWQKMLNPTGGNTYGFGSVYGQEYDYSTTEKINGHDVQVSSGVASYEPGIGSEENPFREIVSYSNKMPLASAQYGAIEMPMLDALYPAAGVGYSKVTVRSIHRKGTHGDSTLRSAIGKQVTEFYTAKDYPVYSVQTPMKSVDYHFSSLLNLFYKDITDRRVTSQGFLVETNDMHGKMKSQIAYSESDEKTPLSYSYHTYKNTGKNGLNDQVDFANNAQGGAIIKGNIGVDMELMTDVREFSVKTNGFNGQIQTDFFWHFPPVFGIFMLPLKSNTENKYRAVTCTKLINYHAIEDSVIVMDKGSVISTKTIAYDYETGNAIVTKTANEFNDPIYNVSYPAYWAYDGMGLAYKNIDRQFSGVAFDNGRISLSQAVQNVVFESGDELYITTLGAGSPGCVDESSNVKKLWAFDTTKNSTALTVNNKNFIFLDEKGNLYNKSGVGFKIVRSGKRNNLGLTVSGATCMEYPIQNGKLVINNADKIVSASAVEYKEKWQVDNDVVKKYMLKPPVSTSTNLIINGDFSQGNIGFTSQYTFDPNSNHRVESYNVGTNSSTWGPYGNCTDHTSATGNMMMVDGSQSGIANFIVWSQSITVQPNNMYNFSVWLQTLNVLYSNNLAQLKVLINGIQVGPILQAFSTPCLWNQFSGIWNSGNASTANISIVDNVGNINRFGNDFAIDDISLTLNYTSCTLVEQEDCGGYLERKINPYVKGLIGNYKPYRGYTYYGDRTETDPAITTSIRKNGYLNNFSNYWNFNLASNNLVPDATNSKWVWNSELTKVNSKGQELETKNALEIYTAAQYGFAKNQATAVANNSRVNEMFAESFEDSNYGEALNTGNYSNSCLKKQIDFDGFTNANSLGFNAHSGKNVIRVLENNFKTKLISLSNPILDQYGLNLKLDTTKFLNQIGSSQSVLSTIPVYQNYQYLTQNQSGGTSLSIDRVHDTVISDYKGYEYELLNTFYINVATCGIKQIAVTAGKGNDSYIGGCNIYCNIYYLNGDLIYSGLNANSTSTDLSNSTISFSRYMPVGIYLVKYTLFGNGWQPLGTFQPGVAGDNFDFSMNGPTTAYSSLTTANGCSFTHPIPATDSMLNPIFSPTPNKKMQFSAWVRENCAIPCTQLSYNNSQVQLQFNDGSNTLVNVTPSGAIIEGWQKVEGDFLIPLTATTMDMKFVNSGTTPNYWDDIRVHPFNANMKSYAYDPTTLRLSAELDENNYATFYEYDEEGQLIRVKKETAQGIKTIKESRSAKQIGIAEIQE